MEIHSNSYSLDMLLSSYSRFMIPELQRPYAWGDDQVRDFVNDVANLVQVLHDDPASPAEHLFGMVVSIGGANDSQSVVDGQQRLTTSTLALGVLATAYQQLHEKQKGGLQDELAIQCLMKVAALKTLLYSDVQIGMPRLKPSNEISLTYESLIGGGDGKVAQEGLQPARRLRAASKIIREELLEDGKKFKIVEAAHLFQHLERVEKVLLKRLKFIHVRTTSPESGYGLFETLNTRGQRLNALDLVKVWIMSQLAGRPVEAMVATQFRGLANDDTDQELRFLRDYFRAQAFRSPDESNEVTFATDVRKYVFKDPTLVKVDHALETEQMIISHVDRMEEWFDLWLQLRRGLAPYSAKKGTADIQVLAFANERMGLLLGSTLRHELVIPLLLHLAAVRDLKSFTLAIHDIERFFFRYKKICGGSVSPMEKAYLSWCSKLAVAPKANLAGLATELRQLLDTHADDEKFASRLVENLKFGAGAAQKTAVYFLQMLEFARGSDDLWARPAAGRHVIEIECLDKAFDDPDHRRRLGNMMLVNDAEKQLLNGKSFADKKALVGSLKGGLSSHLAALALKESTWGSAALLKHEAAITKAAVSAFDI